MNAVFTAGYSGHTVAQLKQAADSLNARVLDIRMARYSRMPAWREEELKKALSWRYVPVPSLGNVNYKTGAPIQIHAPQLGCDIVENLLATNSLILLCGCRDYSSCHRSVVSQMLRARNIVTQELVWPEAAPGDMMKALSIRHPWAWLIAQGLKDIENRDWERSFRGRFLIHASSGMTRREYEECAAFCRPLGVTLPTMAELMREAGGIIGEATIVDCVTASSSPWFVGEFGYVIRDAKRLPFVPFKGTTFFFDVPLSILKTG